MKKILTKFPVIGKYLKAKELSQKTIKEYLLKKDAVEEAKQETQNALELFGRIKIGVRERTLHPFVEQLSRIDDIELIEHIIQAKSPNESKPVTELNQIDIKKDHILASTIAAGGAGAASAAIAYASVGAFASASTGTAISTLTGIYASNATLAFLGGGTLATGGAGIVGGMTVLGGLVTLPVVAVGGYFFNNKVNQDLKKAEQDAETVRQYIEESDKAIVELSKIKRASIQLHRLLVPLESKFNPNIQLLTEIIDRSSKQNMFVQYYYSIKKFVAEIISKMGSTPPEWLKKEARILVTDFSLADQQKVEEIIGLGQMLKNVLDIIVINDDGVVPEETFRFISTVETYLNKASIPV
ncbi:MAG: hypothetical protein WCW35_05290 [Bacteroidota bacterium]